MFLLLMMCSEKENKHIKLNNFIVGVHVVVVRKQQTTLVPALQTSIILGFRHAWTFNNQHHMPITLQEEERGGKTA